MNLSGSLLIWTLGRLMPEFYKKLDNTYIGNVNWEGDDSWGKYYYVAFKEDLSSILLKTLEKHPMYVTTLWEDDGTFLVVFEFDEETQQLIIAPFTRGEYSKIDKNYVDKYFQQFTSTGQQSTNWQIVNKAETLRAYWEKELNVTPYIRISIPEDAEVWSKIKKENEIFGYKQYSQNQEEVLQSV
jgi:hypothetical protein